jgi:hypothetical protein
MENIDREHLTRLRHALRNVNGRSALKPEQERRAVASTRRRAAPEAGPAGHPVWLAVRVLGALAVLAVGIVHLQQYQKLYSEIPTIGTLFVLNFAGATVIALGLLAPLERLLGSRWGGRALSLLALGGVALAATAFVFLAISEQTPLFGFMEPGYDPSAILFSRIAEGATVLLLGSYLVARTAGRADSGWW